MRSLISARMLLVATLFATTTFVAIPTPSASPDAEDQQTAIAKQHFYRAEKLFALRRFERALAEYEAAFEAKPIADFLFNIGQCHVNLGNYEEAIFSFRKFLNLAPNASNRAQVEAYIADLEAKRADREQESQPRAQTPQPILVPKDGNTTISNPSAAGRDQPSSRRFYTRWWFWTGVAAVAAAGTAAILIYDRGPNLPATDLGNMDFPK